MLPTIMMRPMFVFLWTLPLAFWVLMFFVFLAISAVRGVPRTARIDRVARSPYLPRVVMEFGYWMLDMPANACVRLGISPNAITTLSLAFTLAAAACFTVRLASVEPRHPAVQASVRLVALPSV